MVGMVVGVLIFILFEGLLINYILRNTRMPKEKPQEDDWRRFAEEWQRRQ